MPTASVSLPGAGLAEFMQHRGRKVREACGILWHSVEGGLYVSLPHQFRFEPRTDELKRFLWKTNATGVRYPSTIAPGLPCGLYQYTEKRYDLSRLHRNFRAKVRKGMEDCRVLRLDPSDLLKEGLPINLQTMKRQERHDPEFGSESSWTRLVAAIRRSPCIEVFGALVDGHLAAYAITCREDGWLHILHRMSRDEDLEHCPNHLLDYTITREIETDPGLRAVSMGYSSLVAGTEGLHEYKTRLGYVFSPHNSVVRLHPVAGAILTSGPVKRLLRAARSWRPEDQQFEKICAIVHGAELSRDGTDIPGKNHESDHDRALST